MGYIYNWLSYSKVTGNGDDVVSVTVSENTKLTERNATVKIKGETKEVFLTIKQNGFIYQTEILPSSTIAVDWVGTRLAPSYPHLNDYYNGSENDIQLEVITNAKGTLSWKADAPNNSTKTRWIDIDDNDVINPTFNVYINPYNTAREAVFNLREYLNGKYTTLATLTITQSANPYNDNIIYYKTYNMNYGIEVTGGGLLANNHYDGDDEYCLAYDHTLTEIPSYTFGIDTITEYGSNHPLTSVTIPTTVTKINNYCFNKQIYLGSKLPAIVFNGFENVEEIGDKCFFYTNVVGLSLPKLKYMGEYCFYQASGGSSNIFYLPSIEYVGDHSFWNFMGMLLKIGQNCSEFYADIIGYNIEFESQTPPLIKYSTTGSTVGGKTITYPYGADYSSLQEALPNYTFIEKEPTS